MEQEDDLTVLKVILKEANVVTFNLLPQKSKNRYMKELTKFRDWVPTKKVNVMTEEVILVYFNGLVMWSTYSMLKSTLLVFEKVDISKFKTLFAILKSKSKGYQPKKAKTFELKEVEKFINEAPDEIYLLMKTVVVMGVIGACRSYSISKRLIL